MINLIEPKVFRRTVSSTQSKFKIKYELKPRKSDQCSYNLESSLEKYLCDIGAIKEIKSDELYKFYELSTEWKLKISENIFIIIGDEYKAVNNKTVLIHTKSNNKFQLKRTEHKRKGREYEWFVQLYDKNIEYLDFITIVSEQNKTITFDLGLSSDFVNPMLALNSEETFDDVEYANGGTNEIYYGVPGCGKSYIVKEKYCTGEMPNETVVFHPDYSNSDFVGQILPRIDSDGSVRYVFTAGPFARILKKAFENPTVKCALIIEELNRGNAASIFGDIFQLLDRKDNGESKYQITNYDVAKFVFNDENKKIYLPSNLSIIATMNTSDQNVDILDTAFQRRWSMNFVPNVKGLDDLAQAKIGETEVSWSKFWEIINKSINSHVNQMSLSGDKELGFYFASKNEIISPKNFCEKIIKYLWDDAFKLKRDDIFSRDFTKLQEIINHFMSKTGNEKLKIFNNEIYLKLITK